MTALARSVQAAAARPALAWPIAGVVALVCGVAVGIPIVLVALLALIGGLALFLAAFNEPRWVLLVQIALVSSYGVYVLPGHVGVSFTPETLVLLLAVAVVFRRLLQIERPAFPGRDAALFSVLLCAMLASLAFARDSEAAQTEISTYIRNALFLVVLLMLLDSTAWVRRAMWAFVIGVGLLACVAVLQQVTGTYDYGYYGFAGIQEDRGLNRSSGGLNPNFFGQILVSTVPMAFYLGLGAARRIERWAAHALAAVSAVAVWFTYSRGSLAVLVVIALIVALLRRADFRRIAIAIAIAIVVLLILPQRSVLERHFSNLLPSSSDVSSIEDVSAQGRLSEGFAAVRMFMDHPALGVGAGNYPAHYLDYSQEIGLDTRAEERAAHSLYLETLAELGAVGAAVFFWLAGRALLGSWRSRQRLQGPAKLVAEGAFVALLAFLVSSITLHLAYENYFWLVLGLGLATARLTAAPSPASGVDDGPPGEATGSPLPRAV